MNDRLYRVLYIACRSGGERKPDEIQGEAAECEFVMTREKEEREGGERNARV